jgi:hypothetical protein
MKAFAQSTFHPIFGVTFIGLEVGVNYRKLKGPRSDYCLDYNGCHGACGCGYPVYFTEWELPEGYKLAETPREVGNPASTDMHYGKGWIEIIIAKEDQENEKLQSSRQSDDVQ